KNLTRQHRLTEYNSDSDDQIKIKFRGETDTYHIEIDARNYLENENFPFKISCSCPYFSANQASCKHIAATAILLLQFDQNFPKREPANIIVKPKEYRWAGSPLFLFGKTENPAGIIKQYN